MAESYVERVDLPNGQWADLLTRLPYERATMIVKAIAREGNTLPVFEDVVLRAHLWRAKLTNYLEPDADALGADGVGMADPETVDQLQTRAMELYIAWRKMARPKEAEATAPANGESK